MSDFLTNLTAKSLNLAPTVQPRLATRFEPVRPGFGALEISEEVAPPTPVETTGFDGPKMASPAQAPQFRPPATPLAPQFPSPTTGINNVMSSNSDTRPNFDERESERLVEPVRGLEKEPLFQEQPPTRLLALPRTEPVIRETIRQVEKMETQVEIRTMVEKPGPPSPVTPAKVAQSNSGEEIKPTSPLRPALDPFVVQPKITPYIPPAITSLANPRTTESAPAPTINVTIGRIEVRANPTGTPARPAPSSRPAEMSLEEYLRQRSTGGQR